ncbi:MAG: ATP-binding protein, partial [Myxococcota bacterium]
REREGLLQQELQLNTILGETTDFVAAVGLDLSARYVNPAGLALLGFERQDRVFGLSILDLHPPQQRARFEHEIIPVVLSEGRWTGPIELVKRKDEVAVLDAAIILHRGSDGEPSFLSIIARDVTGRARIEEQRREAQKIEAVGRLAGGIAHDFNNLLTAISSFGRFAIETVGQTHEIYPDLEEILSAAEKAEGLTRQLLAFSRKQTVAPKVLLMSDMVRDMERMLQRLLREDVLIETQLDSDPWSVRIDPGAMEQVLINLCVNARDAMPNGGRLQVEVRNRTLDATPSIGIRSGEYVQLRVSDEGTGIDPAVLPRIFEPFFTTKEQGKGTGLGLSTCYGVVKQAGGHLDVQSEPGHGSTFSVFLPRAAEESEVSPEQKPRVAIPSARGTGTVLVAEDNEQVRRLAVRILERRGYTVDSVANGKEALELLEKSP